MYMKRFFALALAILMVVVALPHSPAKAQGKSLQVYLTSIDQPTQDLLNKTIIPAFITANPDVASVEVITGTWGDFDTSLAGWFAAGKGPDIVYLGSEYAPVYGKLLANLDQYINAKTFPALKSYLPGAISTVTFDGHIRGLPLLFSPRPIFYRTDLVKGAPSLKDFKPPLTFTAAVQFAKDNSAVANGAITKQAFFNANPGSPDGLFDSQEFIAAIWAAGGELYKADGTSAFDSAQTKEALQFMYDRRRAILPDEKTATLPAFTGTSLSTGTVVSAITPFWNVPAADDKVWANIAIEPYPAGKAGKPTIQVFTDWAGVPAYSPNPDLAAKFLIFLGSTDNVASLQKIAGYIPPRTDAWDALRKSSPLWNTVFDLVTNPKYNVRGFSDIRGSADLRPMLVSEVNLYLTDQLSLADVQTALKIQYDAILLKDGFLGGAPKAAATAAPTAVATAVATAQ